MTALPGGKRGAIGLALIASVCFGTSGPFAKPLINAGIEPVQAAWIRVAGAALILLPVLAVMRPDLGTMLRRNWLRLSAYGVLGVAGCQAFYFLAAERLPVGVAILLEFTGPILTVAYMRLVVRAPVPRTALTGVLIALFGLACVVQVWSGLSLDGLGLLFGLGAAVCQSAGFLIADRVTGEVSPVTLAAVGCGIGAVALTLLAPPWSIPWHILAESVPVGDGSAPGWSLAIWIVVISTVIAYMTSIASVQRLSAPVAGGVAYTEAVAASLIAWIMLGERLSAVQITGGAIVLAGAYVAQRSVGSRTPAPAPLPEPVPVGASVG